MTNYLFAYHGGGMPESPEEGARIMAAWNGWFGKLGPAIVDGGNPIGARKTIGSDGTVADGASPISGYTIVTADSLDAAVELARGCPVIASGGMVEVGETMPM